MNNFVFLTKNIPPTLDEIMNNEVLEFFFDYSSGRTLRHERRTDTALYVIEHFENTRVISHRIRISGNVHVYPFHQQNLRKEYRIEDGRIMHTIINHDRSFNSYRLAF